MSTTKQSAPAAERMSLSSVPDLYGTPYAGGHYGGQVKINGVLHAFAWAPKALGEVEGIWLPNNKLIKGADSYFDSMANTIAMAEEGSPIAIAALAADINGKTDWCVPARDLLEQGYRYLKPGKGENYTYRSGDNPSSVPAGYPYTEDSPKQTSVDAFKAGGAEGFEEDWYHSSTQASRINAWFQHFYDGGQYDYYKSFLARARFVRLIQLTT